MVDIPGRVLPHDSTPVQHWGSPLWLKVAQVIAQQLCVGHDGDQPFQDERTVVHRQLIVLCHLLKSQMHDAEAMQDSRACSIDIRRMHW